MLNRENAVIAYETERGNKGHDRAEYHERLISSVMLGIENPVRSVLSLSTFVSLGMNVVDGSRDNG